MPVSAIIRGPERRPPSSWGFDKDAPPIVVRDRWGYPYTAEQWLRRIRRHQEARMRSGEEAYARQGATAGRERDLAPVVAVAEGQLL